MTITYDSYNLHSQAETHQSWALVLRHSCPRSSHIQCGFWGIHMSLINLTLYTKRTLQECFVYKSKNKKTENLVLFTEFPCQIKKVIVKSLSPLHPHYVAQARRFAALLMSSPKSKRKETLYPKCSIRLPWQSPPLPRTIFPGMTICIANMPH